MVTVEVEKKDHSCVINPEEVQKQLQVFLSGATRISKVRNPEVAHAAVVLLRSTEAARDACLEHAYNLFDESVNMFLKHEMEERQGAVEESEEEEPLVAELHRVLSESVVREAEVWAPVVSTWALGLLGYLSSKYADRRGSLHASLPEVLQLWMSCGPTRALVDLASQCLATLVGSDPDTCIDALIQTSVTHSPHFDWVVAHIGSCFPTTVITRVLACGLKDFMLQQQEGSAKEEAQVQTPKIQSVVGILGHLASHHEADIRKAVRSLFEDSFIEGASREQLAAGPFLLHLAAMSDTLSHVIASEFVKVVSPDTLNKLLLQVEKWNSAKIPGIDGLTGLVVHLLLRSDGGCQVIQALLNIMPPAKTDILPGIVSAAGLVLDSVLVEIQRRAYGGAAEIPLLHFLRGRVAELTRFLQLPADSPTPSWTLNLLKCMCFHGEEPATIHILGYLLSNVENASPFVGCVYRDVWPHQPQSLVSTLRHQLAELRAGRVAQPVSLVRNITFLAQKEGWLSQVREAMASRLEVLAGQITWRNTEYSDAVVELLSICINPKTMSMASLYNVCTAVVGYHFYLMGREGVDGVRRLTLLCNARGLLATLCQQSATQHAVLRMLLEGSIDPKFSLLFGCTAVPQQQHEPERISLLEQNFRRRSLPQSHSSVFHSGVVGAGLRKHGPVPHLSDDDVFLNRQALVDTIQACCKASWRYPLDETPSPGNSLVPGMKIVALLMVELISPDVMFNGLPWPDESDMKVTVERDLQICRMLEEQPLLWDVLRLVASQRPALCYCSVLLRAAAAALLAHWAASQHAHTTHSPKELAVSQRLISVMAVGQLLPPPLSYIDEVLPLVTPCEAFALLSDVWQFMRDNVPSPALFQGPGKSWRDFAANPCDRKYTNRLRFILYGNIEKFGSTYAKFFPSTE